MLEEKLDEKEADTAELEEEVANFYIALQEKDEQLEEKDESLAEMGEQLAQKEALVVEKDEETRMLKNIIRAITEEAAKANI